jgi:hypothetical protein
MLKRVRNLVGPQRSMGNPRTTAPLFTRSSLRQTLNAVALLLAAVAVAASSTAGCGTRVGDKCRTSADCGSQGNRVCDATQIDGYCTQYGCRAGSCIDSAVCVLFGATPPGCPASAATGVSRFGRSFCAKTCADDGDCRTGYRCLTASGAPWFALVLDTDRGALACLPTPLASTVAVLPQDDVLCRDPVAQPPALADSGPGADSAAAATDSGADTGGDGAGSDGSVGADADSGQ